MIDCLLFLKSYYSKSRKYKLFAGVKYRIKDSDTKYYYTIKNIRIPKTLENKVFNVLSLKR